MAQRLLFTHCTAAGDANGVARPLRVPDDTDSVAAVVEMVRAAYAPRLEEHAGSIELYNVQPGAKAEAALRIGDSETLVRETDATLLHSMDQWRPLAPRSLLWVAAGSPPPRASVAPRAADGGGYARAAQGDREPPPLPILSFIMTASFSSIPFNRASI